MFEDGGALNLTYPGTHKVLSLLNGLNETRSGGLLYHQVRRLLLLEDKARTDTERAYARVLGSLLGLCARAVSADGEFGLRLGLLHALLQPPLTAADLDALLQHLDTGAAEPAGFPSLAPQTLEAALGPLLKRLGLSPEAGSAAQVLHVSRPADPVSRDAFLGPSAEPAEEHESELPGVPGQGESVGRTREELRRLTSELAEHLRLTGERSRELGAGLRDRLGPAAANDALITAHGAISQGIETCGRYLRQFEAECQQLDAELGRVRVLSYTDQLTGLPNRRAFLRRLDNELSRVQRYHYPLALAIMDLDLFKEINDKHGHAAGDRVLGCYTRDVLSIFRNYDMVARYGGEKFAVLLPHTEAEGARRTLSKVRKRAQENVCALQGLELALPTFSAGLALYRSGESGEDLIERADKAMYEAKRLGRNRCEMALH